MFKRLVLLAALSFVGAAQDPAPPPPGQMVDVGGYRVHLYCTGAGYSFDWTLVQSGVSKFTKICTYDVSGTAWSDPGPEMTCAASRWSS